MPLPSNFIADRITALESRIVKLEEALDYLASNPTLSYLYDSGQGVQKVTRNDINDLQRTLDSAINRLSGYCNRQTGSNVVVMTPNF